MTFSDLDNAEATLGKPVTAMTDSELVTYLKLSVRHHQGIELSVDGYPERAIMASLKRVYGTRAGQIVKWACTHHGAQFQGKVIGYFSFAKGRKWFVDMLDTEMQQYLKAEAAQAIADEAAQGLALLKDL